MVIKRLFLFFFCMILTVAAVFAQETSENENEIEIEKTKESKTKSGGDFWISLGGEVLMYSISNPSYGGGLSFGYGKGISIGLKASFFIDTEKFSTIEINFLLRFYLFGMNAYSGPFLQLSVGPAFFFRTVESISVPSEIGMISAGLAFGWRFLFKNRWFVEPAIRGGYPFIAGAGLSAGVRF